MSLGLRYYWRAKILKKWVQVEERNPWRTEKSFDPRESWKKKKRAPQDDQVMQGFLTSIDFTPSWKGDEMTKQLKVAYFETRLLTTLNSYLKPG